MSIRTEQRLRELRADLEALKQRVADMEAKEAKAAKPTRKKAAD